MVVMNLQSGELPQPFNLQNDAVAVKCNEQAMPVLTLQFSAVAQSCPTISIISG